MTQPIALPTIHPGGTNAATLRNEYRKVSQLAFDTCNALFDATCSGLDFCPQGPEAFQQALADRREMLRLLGVVRAYAEAWEARAAEHLRG